MSTSAILWFTMISLAPASDGPAAEGSASVDLDGATEQGDAATPTRRRRVKDNRADQRWIRRWAPERNTAELGVFGGVILPHPRLELFEPSFNLPNQGFVPLRRFAPEVGGRLGYYPLRILGIEAEGAVMPTRTSTDLGVLMWGIRGQLVAQLPWWSVTPFVLAGVSGLGVSSDRIAVGNDLDMGFHFGVGMKVSLSRYVGLRLDVRDNLTARRGVGESVIHTPEVLLGLVLTLGRKKSVPAPLDSDGDGILDSDDRCVDVPGVAKYAGCPIPDTDGDGILDPDDQCKEVPGVTAYQGCPIPDTDGDGILDPDDECVDVPGVAEYKGCPIPDSDGDGFLDPQDDCPTVPETDNGFEDGDGCPDEVPKKVSTFTGVIEGIYFDTAKATIKPKSRAKLDDAVAVLTEYPSLRIEISGHTDDRGEDAMNLELSRQRAEAVKAYFTDRSIAAGRIQTRGVGEAEPIESNETKKGRAKNRRIEFKLLKR
jgi:outer membrane protein OmpA-like peptidoglycan-associated protein